MVRVMMAQLRGEAGAPPEAAAAGVVDMTAGTTQTSLARESTAMRMRRTGQRRLHSSTTSHTTMMQQQVHTRVHSMRAGGGGRATARLKRPANVLMSATMLSPRRWLTHQDMLRLMHSSSARSRGAAEGAAVGAGAAAAALAMAQASTAWPSLAQHALSMCRPDICACLQSWMQHAESSCGNKRACCASTAV